MDKLAQFLLENPYAKLVSDERISSWPLILNWTGQQGEVIKNRLTNVPIHEYDYSDVYNGQTIIIGPDVIFSYVIFQDLFIVNSHLKFHISRDGHYGTPFGVLYSKSINKDLKYKLDSNLMSLFESGLMNSYREIRTRTDRLDIVDFGHYDQSISIDFIVTRIRFFILCLIFLVILLIIETILAAFNY